MTVQSLNNPAVYNASIATSFGGSLYGAITQDNVVTVVGLIGVALIGICPHIGKAIEIIGEARRKNELANTGAFKQMVADAAKEAGTAKAKAEEFQAALAEAQEELKATQAQLKDAQAQIAYLNGEVAKNRHEIRDAKQTASVVSRLVHKVVDQTATQDDQIAELQQHVGSSSNLNIAAAEHTDVDMPTMEG